MLENFKKDRGVVVVCEDSTEDKAWEAYVLTLVKTEWEMLDNFKKDRGEVVVVVCENSTED